jgi:hypothetical protein
MIRISRYQFYIITFLILLLPLSSSWKLLLFGEKTKGIVTGHIKKYVQGGNYASPSFEKTSVIQYSDGKQYYEFYGPEEIVYPVGKEITIFYNPKKPKKFLMFNFVGLFFSQKMIFPGVLLIVWAAFYLTVVQNQTKQSSRNRLKEYKHRLQLRKHSI